MRRRRKKFSLLELFAFKFSNYSFWKFFLNSPIILKIILKIIPTFSQLLTQKAALLVKPMQTYTNKTQTIISSYK